MFITQERKIVEPKFGEPGKFLFSGFLKFCVRADQGAKIKLFGNICMNEVVDNSKCFHRVY